MPWPAMVPMSGSGVKTRSQGEHSETRNVGNSLVARTVDHFIMLSTTGSNERPLCGEKSRERAFPMPT